MSREVCYMRKLSHQQILEYFKHSFKAVDGVWFMKVEEKYDFDTALELDNKVWKVTAKIQSRMIKSFLGLNKSMESLFDGLMTKLELEDFQFEAKKTKDGFQIKINDCPWYNLMIKSGREHLASKIGTKICNTEYEVWASELAKTMKFKLHTQKCGKSENCTFIFLKY
jgi:hypothetical protein